MIVLTTNHKNEWNDIVKSFQNWDIYYLYEYSVSLQLHGDGIPHLIYFHNDNVKICYVMMKNDIANLSSYHNLIPNDQYFDFTTPYGYGGPLIDGLYSSNDIKCFYDDLTQYCKEENIVTQFFRFHPLLQNQNLLKDYTRIVTNKQTIFMDLTSEELIFQNMDTKNRNMIRKAKKNEVTITYSTSTDVDEFIAIYDETMRRNCADTYYYFDRSYYDYILNNLNDHTIFFYAHHNNKIISASIFFYNQNYMHYHLSGTLSEYRTYASTNLLLFEAAKWGANLGIKQLHLGGGVDSTDNLFAFKKQFNKNGRLDFTIGSTVFNQNVYAELVNIRHQNDPHFDINKPYLILYRS